MQIVMIQKTSDAQLGRYNRRGTINEEVLNRVHKREPHGSPLGKEGTG